MNALFAGEQVAAAAVVVAMCVLVKANIRFAMCTFIGMIIAYATVTL
jgi:hypothetical protein